jgi:hypothetical protein
MQIINTRKTGGKTGVMAMAYSPSTQQTISLYRHFLTQNMILFLLSINTF